MKSALASPRIRGPSTPVLSKRRPTSHSPCPVPDAVSTKDAINKNEVAEGEAHPWHPPNEPYAWGILASGGIVDSDVACRIAFPAALSR
jgi:hypothetical protein